MSRNAKTSSARKIAMIFRIPAIVMLTLFLAAHLSGIHSNRVVAAARAEMYFRNKQAQQALDEAHAGVWADLAAGKITVEEANARNVKAGDEWARVMAETSRSWMDSMPPLWLQIFMSLTVAAVLPFLILLATMRIFLGFLARQLGADLRRKGYTWLGLPDLMWLLIALQRDVRKIPLASDFETVPDFHETAESLIEFVRLRKKAKNGGA
ncbi:hypothetical protein BH09SUM1_BH09SUM1_19110 [soil metagenome]